jgi:quinol monooxygenase YgiN
MKTIHVIAHAAIHEGKLDAFKALAAQCMRSVREQDSGTSEYDWFFNEAQTECVVRESYKDSEAVLEHIANVGSTLGAVLAAADWSFEIFGVMSPELVQASAALKPKVYSLFQSL